MDSAQSKSRLLLVDGDPKSLRVLDVSLKKAGFDVTTATSGREALALLEVSVPDLIISDTDLDEMDGFDLCRQIKSRPEWSKIPFLFVSGRKSIEDKIRGLELGVEDYLSKPIYIKEIAIRVRTALQRAERERMESRREGRTRFAGDLSDVGVVDLAQTIELNRKSGIIHIVNRDNRRGSIFFRDGKVIDAEVGRLSGANALYRLFSWSEGRFAVEFKQIRRHDVIDTPMAPLLMEGMRRLDETTRLLDRLPPARAIVEVDCRVLAEELAELPDEMNSLLRLCDGTRSLQEVVEDSDHPDLEALTIVSRLFAAQIVFAREAPDRAGESEPGERLARWLAEGGAEDGVAAEDITASSPSLAPTELAEDGESTLLQTLGQVASRQPLESPSVPTLPPDASSISLVEHGGYRRPIRKNLSGEETLAALLPAKAAAEGKSPATSPMRAGDTLKGVPVEDLFDEGVSSSQSEAGLAYPEPPRPARPLGLAERMLSEDSAVRASAMQEAVADGGGKVAARIATDRNTREYGSPEEGAASLVQDVVSNAHEAKRELPAEPERPSKVVDWGNWPAGQADTVGREASASESPQPLDTSSPGGAEPQASNSDPATSPPAELDASPASPDPAVATEAALTAAQPQATDAEAAAALGEVPASQTSVSSEEPHASDQLTSPSPQERDAAALIGAGYRQLWLFAVGAFALGAIGWVAFSFFFGKGAESAPSDTASEVVDQQPGPIAQASAPEAKAPTRPPSVLAVELPAIADGKAEPKQSRSADRPTRAEPQSAGSSATAAAKPVPVANPAPPALAATAAELRRKCVEVDADGKGKAKSVANACRPALKADPKDVDIMTILARTELDLGRLADARSLARRALAADPNRFEAYIYLGNAEQEAGKIEDARTAYKKYLELAPNGPFANELRAILNNL